MFVIIKKSVDAKIIGPTPTLVASFHNSQPPLIWKFDLERNHSFTLSLQGDEEPELGVTSPKGEFYSVARFATSEDAELAFSVVQKALMKRKVHWIKLLMSLVATAVLLLLLYVLVSGFFALTHFASSLSLGGSSVRNGVPVPADKVLVPPP
jgi:hypothetical protein